MNRSRCALILIGAWLIGCLAAFPLSGAAAQASGTPTARPAPQEVRTPGTPPARPAPRQEMRAEPLHPAPQTIREKWGIRAFLAWLWFTTGVLLYLLRRMIREADRVHGLGYSTAKSARPKKCEPQS